MKKKNCHIKRVSSLVLAFWATAIGPSLCLAGVLTHPCEPHASQDCSHESACAEDPCGQVVKAQDDSAQTSPQLKVSPFPPALLVESGLPAESHRVAEIDPPRKPQLPFPNSDIPLRV